jgi:DNA-binding XRE family transcriptional regulator
MDTDNRIGPLLKRARKAVPGLTQDQVAEHIGISRWTYVACENNRQGFRQEWVYLLPKAMCDAVVPHFTRQLKEQIDGMAKLMTQRIQRPTGASWRAP